MNKKMIAIVLATALIFSGAGWFIRGLSIKKSGPLPNPPPSPPPMSPPSVTARMIHESYLHSADEHIAQIEPVQKVDVRSEISGYIAQMHFAEGAMVQKGDLLFTIDQAQYKAMVAVREAELARTQAELVRTQKYYDRMQRADARSISQADLDLAESDQLSAEANVKQAQAHLNLAKIDLDYTEIKAPICGQIGVAKMTKGNYVTSEDPLAHLIQTDPVRVVFSLSERDYLAHRQKQLSGKDHSRVAQVRLPDGTILPTLGKKDFDGNAINPQTGTIPIRYLFSNADGLLVSGGYVTALIENSKREKGIKIPQKALLTNPKGTYVLTVDEKGLVSTKHIRTGAQTGEDIVVLSGLKLGDCIVVNGIQKASPGATVHVTLIKSEGK